MSIWKKVLDSLGGADQRALDQKIKREQAKVQKDIEQVKKQKKPRKPKVTKTPKQIATEKGEPYINVLSVELDKNNVGNGSFELDWNDTFVKNLRAAGYPGKTDEDVVDMWFRSICRNVLAETFEQEEAQKTPPDNVRYINRTVGPDGKTEVS